MRRGERMERYGDERREEEKRGEKKRKNFYF